MEKKQIPYEECSIVESFVYGNLRERMSDLRDYHFTLDKIERHQDPEPEIVPEWDKGIMDMIYVQVDNPPKDFDFDDITFISTKCAPRPLSQMIKDAESVKKTIRNTFNDLDIKKVENLSTSMDFIYENMKKVGAEPKAVKELHDKWKDTKPKTYGAELFERSRFGDKLIEAMISDCKASSKCNEKESADNDIMNAVIHIKNFTPIRPDDPMIEETKKTCKLKTENEKIKKEEYPLPTKEQLEEWEIFDFETDEFIEDEDIGYFCSPVKLSTPTNARFFEDAVLEKFKEADEKFELLPPEEPEFIRHPYSGYVYWF